MCLLIWKKTNQAENRKRSRSLNKCRPEPISSLFSWLLIVTQGLIVCSEQRERAWRWFSLLTLQTKSSLPGVLTTTANSPFKNKFTPFSSYDEKTWEEEEKRFQNRHKHFLRITHILENQEMEITIGKKTKKNPVTRTVMYSSLVLFLLSYTVLTNRLMPLIVDDGDLHKGKRPEHLIVEIIQARLSPRALKRTIWKVNARLHFF